MKIFSFVGNSGSGKTALLVRIIPELKKRGHTVGVLKHCPHGFSLDPESKDSHRLFEAGADSVALMSSDVIAVFQRDRKIPDFKALAQFYFGDIDFLLVEGGRSVRGPRKVEVLGKGERLRTRIGDLGAVIADHPVRIGRPVFRHSQVKQICKFLEAQPEEAEESVSLNVDGVRVPMNPFVQKVSANIVRSLVRSLHGVKDNPKRMTFTVIEGGKKDEGD